MLTLRTADCLHSSLATKNFRSISIFGRSDFSRTDTHCVMEVVTRAAAHKSINRIMMPTFNTWPHGTPTTASPGGKNLFAALSKTQTQCHNPFSSLVVCGYWARYSYGDPGGSGCRTAHPRRPDLCAAPHPGRRSDRPEAAHGISGARSPILVSDVTSLRDAHSAQRGRAARRPEDVDQVDSLYVIEMATRHFFIRAEMGKNAGRKKEEVDEDYKQAEVFAALVAPYRYARLSAVKLAGDPNNPVHFRDDASDGRVACRDHEATGKTDLCRAYRLAGAAGADFIANCVNQCPASKCVVSNSAGVD